MYEDPVRWRRIDEVLSAALQLPPDERLEFVRQRTTGDADLGRAVEELLRAESAASSFLERPIRLDSETWLEASAEYLAKPPLEAGTQAAVGRVVGAWRIVRELGRGGMATVYLAERVEGGFDQLAALKLLASTLDADIVDRFRAERQILSNLSHPNIARLLDGGSTAAGQPYLVLEAVDGRPITEWCDSRSLPVRARLELFRDVLSAVAYAHANLVVHRDLKPSNILVTDEGRVKLLDFGIAQLLEGDAPGARRPRLLLTPDYASPEQVSGEPITTASDTYQLGLLLFRLLTRTRPYEVDTSTRETLKNSVLSARPAVPSRVVDGRSGRALRGDLDAIVARALRRDPFERYASVGDLDADLANHLSSRPVLAVDGGAKYRIGKYFRRNRWALPTLAAAMVAAAAYVGVQRTHERQLEAERNVAQAEAVRAEAVKDFLVELFRSPDPWESARDDRDRNITVREALAHGTERIRTELRDQPDIKVELLATVAGVYENLSMSGASIPLLEDAIATQLESEPSDAATLVSLRRQLGEILMSHGLLDSAQVTLARALEGAETLDASHDTSAAIVHVALASLAGHRGRYDEAADLLYVADSLLSASPRAEPMQQARLAFGIASTFSSLDRLDEARTAAERRVELVEGEYGRDDPRTAAAVSTLADVLKLQGDEAGAIALHEEAAGVLERTLGEGHDTTLSALNNLALALGRADRYEEAEIVLRQILAVRTEQGGIWHRDVAEVMQNLATVLRGQGKLDETIDMLSQAHEVFVTVLPPGHYLTAFPLLTRSSVELERKRYRSAEATTRQALAILGEALPPDHAATAMARCRLGRALLGQGLAAEAAAPLRRGVEVAVTSEGLSPEYRAECVDALATLEGHGAGASADSSALAAGG